MNAYERAMAMMGDQLDAGQKKRLYDAAQLLDQGNAETRRSSYSQQQTGIIQDTQQLAGQGLAGNAYSGFQSGAQERRVNTRNGVFDLTVNSLNQQESNALVGMGQNLIAQARAEEAMRRLKAQQAAQGRAKLSLNPLVQEKRAFSDRQPILEGASAPAAKTVNPWQAAYSAVQENTGTGAQGVLNLITQKVKDYKETQAKIYDSVRATGGVGVADTMFGVNPIKNAQNAQQAAVAADVIKLQQERYAPLDKKSGTSSIGAIDSRLDEIDAAIATARYSLQYAHNPQQIVDLNKQINEYKKEKEALKEDRTNLSRRMKATIYTDYMNMEQKTDFEKKSAVDTKAKSDFYRGINGMFAKNDPTGAIKSLNENVLHSYAETSLTGNSYESGVEAAKYITDEEKRVYNYIYATQGDAKAQEFITDMSSLLNARYAEGEYTTFSKMAEDKPILASAMTIFGSLAKAQGMMYSITEKGEIDPNSPFFMASRVSQIIRGEVAANIADGIGRLDRYSPEQLTKMGYSKQDITRIQSGELRAKGSEALGAAMGFLYQTGLSIGDFLLTSAAGGPSALMIMGTGAASDTVLNARQRGASDGQALTLGIIAGVAEVITEKFSLDHFYKMKVGTKLANLQNILAQMGIEASEEMASEIINIIGDGVVMADDSNSKMMMNAYMAAGMSHGEAWMEVFKQNSLQVMLAGLGGALSGGVIASGKLAGMRIISSAKNGKIDLTNPETQKELSGEYRQQQKRNQKEAAQDAVTRIENVNLGDLKATDSNPVKTALVDVAAAELKGKGAPDTEVQEVKTILEKSMSGEPLTAAERFTIISNPTVREAFNITEAVPKLRIGENGKMQQATEKMAPATRVESVTPSAPKEVMQTIAELSARGEYNRPVAASSSAYKSILEKRGMDGISLASDPRKSGSLIESDNDSSILEFVYKKIDVQNGFVDGWIIPSYQDAGIAEIGSWKRFYDTSAIDPKSDAPVRIIKPARMTNRPIVGGEIDVNTGEVMEKPTGSISQTNAFYSLLEKGVMTNAKAEKVTTVKPTEQIVKETKAPEQSERMTVADIEKEPKDQFSEKRAKLSEYGIDWKTAYTRWYGDKTPMSRAGYAMFVDPKEHGTEYNMSYGNTLYTYNGENAVHVIDIMDDIATAWENTPEEKLESYNLGYMKDASPSEVAEAFNPRDIVDTANGWDGEELVGWLYWEVLQPKGIDAIITNDGALVFDKNKIKKFNGDKMDIISDGTHVLNSTDEELVDEYNNREKAQEQPIQELEKPSETEPVVESKTELNPASDLPGSTKSQVYKEQLAKSFVKDVSDSIGISKDTGAAKELAKVINTVMENNTFSSDQQNALFEKIKPDLPAGTNVARARIAFDDATFTVRMNLGLVDRYEAARHAKAQQKATRAADANDMQLVKKALEDRKPLARWLQQIKDNNIFTQADMNDVEYILKGGEVNLEGRTNAEAFKQLLEAERKLRAADRIISDYNKGRNKALFEQALNATSGSEAWKDKTFGIQYSTETMERNFEDIVKDPAQAALLTEIYMKPIHINEADSTRFKNEYRARVDALNLNDAEKIVVQQIGQNMTWEATEAQLGKDVISKANKEKVYAAADAFRSIYDELISAANEVLIRNGYPPIEYRKGYYPHFNDPEADTVMKKVAQALGINVSAEELPTDIAGLTSTYKPRKTWFGHMLERKGETTTIDAVKGFETYITGISDIIYHTDDIQRWRSLESALRYEHSNEAIRKRMLDVMGNTSYDPDLQQAEMDAIFNEKQGHLGKLVTEIREYTNLLANKKSMHDRSVEADLGRKMYSVVNSLNSRVAANMIAGNVGVALTNFIPLTQAWASTDTKNLVLGMTQSLASIFKDDGFSIKSDFVTNRKGSESLDVTGAQKAAKIAAIPFTLVDNFVAESIVRAQTMQNIEKGMSPEDALQAADEWAGRIMADRSKGALPTYFKRSNPLSKVFGMFQVEVNNQMRHAFKDLPRALRDKGLAAIAMALFKLCLGAWVYNEVTEPITGRRAALDPVNILMEFGLDLAKKDLGTATLTQFMLGKGETPWKLQDKDVSTTTAIENLWGNLMDQTPFVGTFLGGEGGRIPISSALPDMWAIGKDVIAAMSGDGSWKKAGDTAGKELTKPLFYLLPPFGGGQAKKFLDGVATVAQGGSYKLSDKGEQRIQFTTEQGLREYLQAAIFGKWSLPQAQEYIRSGFDMMTPRESEGWKAADKKGVGTDYMRARMALGKIEATKDKDGNTIETKADRQRRALMNLTGLTADERKLFDRYLIAGENTAPADYSSETMLELSLRSKEVYQNALGLKNNGITPEKYLDYLDLKKEYEAAAQDQEKNTAQQNYFTEMSGQKYETLSPEKINDRMHDAIWADDELTMKQKFQLEAKINGSDTWIAKAAKAVQAGVLSEKFYNMASKVREHAGNNTAEYAWSVIRADRSLTAEQQLKLQEIIAGADNHTKMAQIQLAGVPKEPALRYLALYRDYKASDDANELDYSDNVAFKLAVSREPGMSAEDKMKITDAVIGSNSKLFGGWQQANVIAGVKPKDYYSFQMKYLQTDGKDKNGKTVNNLKKRRLKEYLMSLNISQEQREYLLLTVGNYKSW